MQLTKKDTTAALKSFQSLTAGKNRKQMRKNIRLVVGTQSENAIDLPPQAIEALTEVLGHLAEGREVIVSAQPVEYSTQQAAEFLRVSRPFLVGLLEKGEIPFRKVGTHRRVLFADLKSYKEKIDAQRLKTLDELTAQAQELRLGY